MANKETMYEIKLRIARNITNQLFDLAEIPVSTRQILNDKADVFIADMLDEYAMEVVLFI